MLCLIAYINIYTTIQNLTIRKKSTIHKKHRKMSKKGITYLGALIKYLLKMKALEKLLFNFHWNTFTILSSQSNISFCFQPHSKQFFCVLKHSATANKQTALKSHSRPCSKQVEAISGLLRKQVAHYCENFILIKIVILKKNMRLTYQQLNVMNWY